MERTRNNEPAFLDIHAVARRYNVTRATIWSWMAQGRIPQPMRITPGCSRWALDDLQAWEAELRSECAPRNQWEELQRRKQQQQDRR